MRKNLPLCQHIHFGVTSFLLKQNFKLYAPLAVFRKNLRNSCTTVIFTYIKEFSCGKNVKIYFWKHFTQLWRITWLGIKSTLRFAAGELVFVRPHQDDLLLAAHGIHTLLRWAMVWY